MKTKVIFTAIVSALLLIVTAGDMPVLAAPAKSVKESPQQVITIRGRIVDAETNQPLVFAGITVQGSNISTVTNLDGEFTLKLPGTETGNLEFSFIGYKNRVMAIEEMKTNGQRNIIRLETALIPIREVVVKPLVPEEIIEQVIRRFDENYPGVANDMTGFYRETIRKNRSYISIGEALVEIFKAPYQNSLRWDAVRIYKGRKSNDVEKMDTVLFKLQGGPTTTLYLDVVKNPEMFLTREALTQYDLELSNIAMIDDRSNYVINFYRGDPEVRIPLPEEAKAIVENIGKIPGGQQLIDNVLLSINRAAEDAARDVAPIFVNSVMQMTITDGYNILHGADNAATVYLKNTTWNGLYDLYKPKISASTGKEIVAGVSAQDSWNTLTDKWNQVANSVAGRLAGFKPVNTDLDDFLTRKALEGVFLKLEGEELKIRKEVSARVTPILREVFGTLDQQ